MGRDFIQIGSQMFANSKYDFGRLVQFRILSTGISFEENSSLPAVQLARAYRKSYSLQGLRSSFHWSQVK